MKLTEKTILSFLKLFYKCKIHVGAFLPELLHEFKHLNQVDSMRLYGTFTDTISTFKKPLIRFGATFDIL